MSAVGKDFRRALMLEGSRRIAKRTGRIDDIVDKDARPSVDVADDIHDFRFAGALAAFVDDRQRGVVEALGEAACPYDAADIGRHHNELAVAKARVDVGRDHWRCEQIVSRDVKESLDLTGMKIDRENSACAGDGDQIGDELGRNGRTWSRLS